MKLSEVRGERTMQVLGDIIGPIFSIVRDDKVGKRLAESSEKGKDKADMAAEVLPYLLREHRRDIVEIMAAIEGVTPEEYERDLTLASLLKDAYDVLTDEELLAFLS